MKNITVTLDEETYRKARIRAAELETSVSAVVRKYLTDSRQASQGSSGCKGRKKRCARGSRSFRLKIAYLATNFTTANYERHCLPRHKHPALHNQLRACRASQDGRRNRTGEADRCRAVGPGSSGILCAGDEANAKRQDIACRCRGADRVRGRASTCSP